jgi:energy-coupling factor transporter ATP-binding protein EcfA2
MRDLNNLPQDIVKSLIYLVQEKIKRDGKGRVNPSGKGSILCLYHEENNPSLHFNLYKGLIRCFGCGKRVSSSEFLRDLKESLGYNWASTDADYKKIKEVEATLPEVVNETVFVYRDEKGRPLCYKWRRDFLNGGKDFNLFNPDGEEMSHFFGLYALPLVAKSKETYFVEGEKVADALIQIGLPATTLCRGASGNLNKLERQALLALKGRKVFLCPDADKSGFRYMAMVEKFLRKKGIETVFVKPPENLTDGDDLYDYIQELREQGLNDKEIKENILRLTKEDIGTPFDEIQAKPIDWAIPDWIPKGRLTILAGREGVGKTRLALVLACAKANGSPVFTANGFKEVKAGAVFYFTLEDEPLNLAYWCDVIGIKRSPNLRIFEPEGFRDILRVISKHKPELIIIDPASYLISDEKSLEGVKPILEPLVRLAKKDNIAIVAVWHLNKRETSDVGLAVSGHSRITAMAKRLIVLDKRENKTTVHFRKTKNTESVAFFVDDEKFEWVGGNNEEFGSHIPQGEKIAQLIKQELEKSPNRELPFNEIIRLVSPFGITKKYLSIIKDRYLRGVISKPVRKNGKFIGWAWSLPDLHQKTVNLDESLDNSKSAPDLQIVKNIPKQELTVKNSLKINDLQTQEKNNSKKLETVNLDESLDNQGFSPDLHKRIVNLAQMAKKNQNSLKNQDFFSLKVPVIPEWLLKKYKIENPEIYEDLDFRMFAIGRIVNHSKQKRPDGPEKLPIIVIDGKEYIDADELFKMEGVKC